METFSNSAASSTMRYALASCKPLDQSSERQARLWLACRPKMTESLALLHTCGDRPFPGYIGDVGQADEQQRQGSLN
jgi:hypothetical protein